MQDFQHGPFEFTPSGLPINFNGKATQRWEMRYGLQGLGVRALPASADRGAIIDAFEDARADFILQHKPKTERPARSEPFVARLVRSTEVTGVHGAMLGQFVQQAPIAGLAAGLIDDRYATWLVNQAGQCLPMGEDEFARLQAAHEALSAAYAELHAALVPVVLPRAWLSALLPAEVLERDPKAWRAPTSWELRHVVGDGSFTGATGMAAAGLVGVTPQNFRKYLARDGSRTQQLMSYAMWHLLLQRLGVQTA